MRNIILASILLASVTVSALTLDLRCGTCGKKLGTVTYPDTVAIADAQRKASEALCGACAKVKADAAAAAVVAATEADAKAKDDKAKAKAALLDAVAKAKTIDDLRPVLAEIINRLDAQQ
ncbi:MAG: hypothetical protein A3K19_00565 [Lentisphaerae bacterium RIFOXYB12_FULL_65_16]|nr:MAG: hypothetical protein A3K18_14945 [Lentisphaerae bacterium RIFOXYA12_64_32]OGV86782.1 MAG: hypothetical protein A3K19_00565 [Lentisphaerae bacterium RIFOXYB12_FULL_65_16]